MIIQAFPISRTFPIKADSTGEASFIVRQARQGENIERNDFYSEVIRMYNDTLFGTGNLQLKVKQNVMRLQRHEAYLTLQSITGINMGEDGQELMPLFRSRKSTDGEAIKYAMTEDEFSRAWGMLPSEVVEEIMQGVYAVNPEWNPEYRGELSSTSEE